jgi:hypothetical protein
MAAFTAGARTAGFFVDCLDGCIGVLILHQLPNPKVERSAMMQGQPRCKHLAKITPDASTSPIP